jgi:uncharacterized protein (TIGR01777 family)
MKIVLAGASGLIGHALAARLRADGHAVIRLVRRPAAAADERTWAPSASGAGARASAPAPSGASGVPGAAVPGVPAEVAAADAVINLAGAGIADGRWTARRRALLRTSRLEPTLALVAALRAAPRPRVLVNASAVGYYGDRGDELLTETSALGSGFLAELCRDWEAAAEGAESAGARVVRVRFGVVLAAQGGALPRLLPLFRLGLGGRLGSGRQWMSWIALDDAVGVLRWALGGEGVRGPVNVVAPEPVTNGTFTAALAHALHRPVFLPVPGPLLAVALGEMARETLLAGARVEPHQLLAGGYSFVQPRLDNALRQILGAR